MTLAPPARRLFLTLHVGSSVGWIGAVVTSLVLAVAGLTSPDPQVVRSVYDVLQLVGWAVLVPFSVASLATGLIQSLGTRWGLFRHYWVIVKLVLNLLATTVLLLYMQTLSHFAELARGPGGIETLRSASPVLHSAGALLLLAGAMVLSIYKPRGMTNHGRRTTAARAFTS